MTTELELELKVLCDRIGAKLEIDASHGFEVLVMCPDGKMWAGQDFHEFVKSSVGSTPRDRELCLQDALDDVKASVAWSVDGSGFQPCMLGGFDLTE